MTGRNEAEWARYANPSFKSNLDSARQGKQVDGIGQEEEEEDKASSH